MTDKRKRKGVRHDHNGRKLLVYDCRPPLPPHTPRVQKKDLVYPLQDTTTLESVSTTCVGRTKYT